MMAYKKENLIKFLKDNNVEFKEYNHKPLFTVEESKKLRGEIIGNHTKNLFLKDKKKNFFLLSCSENKTIDLKKLRNPINANNLSFYIQNLNYQIYFLHFHNLETKYGRHQ